MDKAFSIVLKYSITGCIFTQYYAVLLGGLASGGSKLRNWGDIKPNGFTKCLFYLCTQFPNSFVPSMNVKYVAQPDYEYQCKLGIKSPLTGITL